MRCRIFASLALAAVAITIAAAQGGDAANTPDAKAQEAKAQAPQPPTFRTEANFVRVDVYPTAKGRPVLDLRAEDFELSEDGAAQTIQSFEHVLVTPAGPQDQRSEPNSIEESRQLAANPRNRVFVLFLDTPHVSVDGAWHAREPLIRLIDRVLGPDDLVGIMLPKMAASDVVLARKTAVIASGLRNIWPWGERFTLLKDQTEQHYETCYPTTSQDSASVTREMIARKRERATLDALHELVLYLRDLREERKAIVTVSEGWLLFKPSSTLTSAVREGPPQPVNVGPDGRLTRQPRNSVGGENPTDCDADRLALSLLDDEQYFRQIIGEANRANAAFYTVDPRGLPVFDTPIGPAPPPGVIMDAAMLRGRLDSLRTLADGTDGMAVLNSNDLDAGMRRISDDLSSYYLLGYYTSNAKLDGRFHNIKVRVKRPGVDVRARKGYLAATAAEISAAKKAANLPVSEAHAAVTSAMSALSRLRPDSRFILNAVPVAAAGSNKVSTLWVAGELQAIPGAPVWLAGGTVDLEVKAGGASTTARVTLAPGERAFALPVTLTASIDSGMVEIRARATGPDASAEPLTDFLRLDLAQGLGQPMLYRRGPSTANRLVPAAAFLFSRTERARVEFAAGADTKADAARLLDTAGQPLAVPVTLGERTDDRTMQRWITADVTLAPLASGDYGIELSLTTASGPRKVLTAIRVGR
ncbi:MAG: VWA domain-containing protein [Acidobacteriota bacterium]